MDVAGGMWASLVCKWQKCECNRSLDLISSRNVSAKSSEWMKQTSCRIWVFTSVSSRSSLSMIGQLNISFFVCSASAPVEHWWKTVPTLRCDLLSYYLYHYLFKYFSVNESQISQLMESHHVSLVSLHEKISWLTRASAKRRRKFYGL